MKIKSKYLKHLKLLEKLEDSIKNSRNKSSQTQLNFRLHASKKKERKISFIKRFPIIKDIFLIILGFIIANVWD